MFRILLPKYLYEKKEAIRIQFRKKDEKEWFFRRSFLL